MAVRVPRKLLNPDGNTEPGTHRTGHAQLQGRIESVTHRTCDHGSLQFCPNDMHYTKKNDRPCKPRAD